MQATSLRQLINLRRSERQKTSQGNEYNNTENSSNGENADALTQFRRMLSKFKLGRGEIDAYLYLARAGAQRAQKVAECIGVERTEVYRILGSLEAQGLVTKLIEKPARFNAQPFEKVLDSLIKERKRRVHLLEQQRSQLIDLWNELPRIDGGPDGSESMQVVEGRRQVVSKVEELLMGALEKVEAIVQDHDLIWLYNSMFFDEADNLVSRGKISLKILTNYSSTSEYILEKLGDGFDFTFLKEGSQPSFFLSDSNTMLLLMKSDSGDLMGMYTNSEALVASFRNLFNFMWSASTNGSSARQSKLSTKIPY